MKALAFALFVLAPLTAFSGDGSECHHPAKPTTSAEAPRNQKEDAFRVHRGAKFSGAPKVELEALLANPELHDGKTVTMTGKVRKACERKGCWMEIALSDKAAGVRVTFKDYGFFVPLDSAGATARIEGVVKVTELSDKTASHYESEGATVPRGTDGKAREIQLVAAAVELTK